MSKIDYTEKVLRVKDLKKYFYVGVGKNKLVVPAVDGVSFDIHKREVFGLVGESGCGKTTTGRTIIKLYNPTDGTVLFNDVPIGAGYETYVNNIKRLKEEYKTDLFKLKPNGEKILDLRNKANREILEIEYKIKETEFILNQEIEKINQELFSYRETLYNTKNEYVLRVEAHEYEYENKKREYIDSTVNQAKEEYDRELAKIKLRYSRSSDGLKDSAALEKELIAEKLEEIKKEHLVRVEDLRLKYEPLIEEAQKDICSKKDIKAPLKEIKAKLNEQKAIEKEQYKEEITSIPAPNKEEINVRINKAKEKAKEEILELKKQIKEIKERLKLEEKQLSSVKGAELDKEEINKLKEIAKEKIAKEKQKIKEAKVINKSDLAKDEITKMQMIFQDPISSLNPRMTVREIVAEGLTIQKQLSKEEIDEKVKEMLEVVGLSADYMARYPHEFSGGQRQRIGVARALIMQPNLIIADEPISALDVSIRAQVLNLLTDLKDELGLTILFIAHDLSVVRFFCDTIAVMYYGKIVEMASAEDLFKNPMHPYTVSLLSAVPQPDPDYEKGRKRIFYDPRMHDYRFDRPTFREIGENHFVLANNKEFEEMKKQYSKVK